MKKRVLLIDDDKQLNRINERVLSTAGIVSELHIALDGRAGLEYLYSRIEKNYPMPHVIVLDLEMPVLSGFEFLDEFQKMNFAGKSNIEIVIFTSSSNPKDKQKAMSKGIRHYLTKPYLLRGLQDILRRL
jgi:CheY-like chemotaxis protein